VRAVTARPAQSFPQNAAYFLQYQLF